MMGMQMDEDRDHNRTYPTAEFLKAVEKFEPASTSEVAGFVGCHPDTAYNRLTALEQTNEVKSKTIGRELAWLSAD